MFSLPFTLKDVIDIFLFALLLYYIYRVMKASSAATIFLGVLIFLGVWFFVSKIFTMSLLGFVMDKLVDVGLLALIILFQEEIRHFFSTLGTHHTTRYVQRLFSRRSEPETPHREEIMPIVMACMNMSKQKVGALIIIERAVALGEVANTGENINADITQRLIENIFFKNSPLHDGAMLVSHGRIKSVGCILPVAHDADIPKALGLRHRAALGISQKCDCIAIVVSEETGGISIAMDGDLRLRLSPEELERTLTDLWEQ